MKGFNYLVISVLFNLIIQVPNSMSQSKSAYERIYLIGKEVSSAVYWEFKVSEGRNKNFWTKIPAKRNAWLREFQLWEKLY